MSLVSNERRENALDNDAYSFIKIYLPFYWDTRYCSKMYKTKFSFSFQEFHVNVSVVML